MSRYRLDSLEFSFPSLRESVHDGYEHQSLHIQFLKYFVLRKENTTKKQNKTKETNELCFAILFQSCPLLVFLSWYLIPGLEKEKGWMHACLSKGHLSEKSGGNLNMVHRVNFPRRCTLSYPSIALYRTYTSMLDIDQ